MPSAVVLPAPRVNITIRPGTLADVAFMDALQKKTTKQVGWMPTKQFEGKIAAGHVLIAESVDRDSCFVACEGTDLPRTTSHEPRATPLGYLIGSDQYFKRDDVGVIYQINVIPEVRRSLVAASLLKAQFERSAYGCRLYCCWCAQDIEANRFWEAMGFVPLAFRTGSRTKGKNGAARMHIFWQKRIRAGDATTPWWFPSKTAGGAMNEDRIVLPIPPGVSWRDEMPILLPEPEMPIEGCQLPNEEKAARPTARLRGRVSSSSNRQSQIANRQCPKPVVRARVQFGPPVMEQAAAVAAVADPAEVPTTALALPAKAPRKAKKADPRMIAAARELRDRWLERVNAEPSVLTAQARYDIGKTTQIALNSGEPATSRVPLLPSAMAA
jgi:hypothetical protein